MIVHLALLVHAVSSFPAPDATAIFSHGGGTEVCAITETPKQSRQAVFYDLEGRALSRFDLLPTDNVMGLTSGGKVAVFAEPAALIEPNGREVLDVGLWRETATYTDDSFAIRAGQQVMWQAFKVDPPVVIKSRTAERIALDSARRRLILVDFYGEILSIRIITADLAESSVEPTFTGVRLSPYSQFSSTAVLRDGSLVCWADGTGVGNLGAVPLIGSREEGSDVEVVVLFKIDFQTGVATPIAMRHERLTTADRSPETRHLCAIDDGTGVAALAFEQVYLLRGSSGLTNNANGHFCP